ncbi:MAG: hypothetical protein J7647_10625 [Cyanobacteria bacterium SBLK]|nr:hypothetical protein [Cyanobacteria bacterium SBLK]
MAEWDWDRFKVMSKISNASISEQLGLLVQKFVSDPTNQKLFEERLDYLAKKHGMTPEECFNCLRDDQPLPEPAKQ